jgi:hypothetical protein
MTEKIASLVGKENHHILSGAIVQLVMGSIYCAISWSLIFVALLIPSSFVAEWVGMGTIAVNLIATILVVSVCFWSAFRKVNPFEHIDPMTERQKAMATVASMAGLGHTDPRRSVAGIAWFLLAGPETLLDGVASWKHRLPTGTVLFCSATDLLGRCENGLPAQEADPPEAFMLLMRLSLIKLVSDMGTRVELTQKGRGVLRS